jgi:hypothetical protein
MDLFMEGWWKWCGSSHELMVRDALFPPVVGTEGVEVGALRLTPTVLLFDTVADFAELLLLETLVAK